MVRGALARRCCIRSIGGICMGVVLRDPNAIP